MAGQKGPVRYAVVGPGHIAQVAVLPAFAHARRNSRVVALVSDDHAKWRVLSERYRIDAAYSYEEYDTSFNAADVASYRIVGTKGELRVDPAYEYAEGLAYELTINGKTKRTRIGKRDQFAPELLYFSDCILSGRAPEPSGEEGLQDVRIVQALYESAETGKAVRISPFEPSKRPTGRQRIVRPGVRRPKLVNARSASED